MRIDHWLSQYFYTKNYLYRLFGTIVVVLVFGIALRNWLEYRTLNEETAKAAYRDAEILQEYFVSVQHVYLKQILTKGVELDHNTVDFLPVHTAPLISEDFQKRTTQGMNFRNISDDNRNPKNAPYAYEREAIEYFKNNPNKKEFFRELHVDNKRVYFYAAPIKIEPFCLMCHGKQEDAPAYIRNTYSTGYNYQIGDIRGISSITIEKNILFETMQAKYKVRVVFSLVIVIMTIMLIFLLVRRAKTIETKMMQHLEEMSFTDSLTGLWNRRKLMEWIEQYHKLFLRYGEKYTLIMVDIDYFKVVNDSYGHPQGDTVLQEFSKILRLHCRQTDHIGRWGGEEFMFILPKTTLNQAVIHAEVIRKKIEEYTFESIGKKTASFGVAEIQPNESIEMLISRVDRALYHAKGQGRNRVCVE